MRIKKDDIWGVGMAVGVAVITGLTYFVGKLSGKGEAYGECADMLKEAIESAEIESDE